MNDIKKENIQELIDKLPQGNISCKKINGKVYPYYQWMENGKQRSRVVKKEELLDLTLKIEERKRLQQEQKSIKNDALIFMDSVHYSTVFVGEELKDFVNQIEGLKQRDCYKLLNDYVYGNSIDKVFILYGLRRTGKTTLIKQVIYNMKKSDFDKTAYIKVHSNINLFKINADLNDLYKKGYKYVFIDEVTLMNDFISSASLFSDVYASKGMKIVLSGTDSLGFIFSQDYELYDRCFIAHTTFISYHEFYRVLNIKGIDNYIKYGGTMSMGGFNYNKSSIFYDKKTTEEYIDSAIAHNIQHSLKNYNNGNHFRNLALLYNQGELTNVINRVVEHENKKFTIEILTKEFESGDLSLAAKNLIKDKMYPSDILFRVDRDGINEWFRRQLDILNTPEMKIKINQMHVEEIKEYLQLLDLIKDIDVININDFNSKENVTVITQPGMRFSQATTLINALMRDNLFKTLSLKEKNIILDRLMSTIKGKMMEDIVLLETKMANPQCEVFKLRFAIGEYDMVVFDPRTSTCKIYEIKYGNEVYPNQYQHLIDETKLKITEFRYGDIKKRCVIYNGSTHLENGIEYINVDEYLLFNN